MTVFGLSSKREITRTSIRVRTAMAAETREQGRYLGSRLDRGAGVPGVPQQGRHLATGGTGGALVKRRAGRGAAGCTETAAVRILAAPASASGSLSYYSS
jgi:hypothetical protein